MEQTLDCPHCDDKANLIVERQLLKGVYCKHWYYKCTKCNEEFTTTESDTLTLDDYSLKKILEDKHTKVYYKNKEKRISFDESYAQRKMELINKVIGDNSISILKKLSE